MLSACGFFGRACSRIKLFFFWIMEHYEKIYYLPAYRSILIGAILLLMGLAFTFGFADYSQPFWSIVQNVLVSFESLGDLLFSLVMLLFKAGFIIGGFLYMKYADKVERARLDQAGFRYLEMPRGNKYDKIAMDMAKLTFVPYRDIEDIECRKNLLEGWQLYLVLSTGAIKLDALGVLKRSEKEEIVRLVKQHILNRN